MFEEFCLDKLFRENLLKTIPEENGLKTMPEGNCLKNFVLKKFMQTVDCLKAFYLIMR